MDPLDTILTSLVDSIFPVTRGKPASSDGLMPCLLGSIVHKQREVKDSHDE